MLKIPRCNKKEEEEEKRWLLGLKCTKSYSGEFELTVITGTMVSRREFLYHCPSFPYQYPLLSIPTSFDLPKLVIYIWNSFKICVFFSFQFSWCCQPLLNNKILKSFLLWLLA
jgi:hypothetical protein